MVDFEIIDIIRKIVVNEVRKIHVAEIGEVTSVYPHSSDGDEDNYECNVKLKYRDLELRRVPVTTQHIGLANIPHVGDMVLVTFINGEINAPVVIGRLYTAEDRPPLNKEEEIVYIPPYSENGNLRRVHMEFPGGMVVSIKDDMVKVEAGKTTLTINRDGNVEIKSQSNISIKAKGDLNLSATNIKLKADQGITMEGKNMNVKMEKSDMDVKLMSIKNTNFQLEAEALVKLKSSANLNIEGGLGVIQMSGPLTIKGAVVNIN